jgi:hypothetical protein
LTSTTYPQWISPATGAVDPTTEGNVSVLAPEAFTARSLAVDIVASSNLKVYKPEVTFTLRDNGSDTALTCTTGTTPGPDACSDDSDSVAIATGDRLSIGVTCPAACPTGAVAASIALRLG